MTFCVAGLQLEGAWSSTWHWQSQSTDSVHSAWTKTIHQVCSLCSDLHHSNGKDWCPKSHTLLHNTAEEYVFVWYFMH